MSYNAIPFTFLEQTSKMSVGNGYHSNMLVFAAATLLLLGGVYFAPSPISHARIVNGIFSNLMYASTKWAQSLKSTSRPVTIGRPMMKFESGYTVETVFDGSKLGVEPFAVEVLPSGELLILDSTNSNLYKIPTALSLYSRPKLIAGSAEGYTGHVDGKNREARMNHPKGVAVDHKGNIYVADNMNMAVRKISDSGVTTIAGGRSGRSGHVDGASEDAKFSNDFDVVYIGSSCSLLVIDRGNKAIREIQLHFDDCAYQYESGFPRGMTVLLAAGFFGYMLALLQRRIGLLVSSQNDLVATTPIHSEDKVLKSVRPPLIPKGDEADKQDDGLLVSLGKLVSNTGSSLLEISRCMIPDFGKKRRENQYESQQGHVAPWPMQDSYVIRDDDEPPAIETRTPTPKKTYPFMSKDAERVHQWQQGKSFYGYWDDIRHQKMQQQQQSHTAIARTFYELSNETTKDITFGSVHGQHGFQKTAAVRQYNL